MASMTCSNCQTESAEGTAVCPSCGAALVAAPAAPAAAAAPATPPSPPPAAAPPAAPAAAAAPAAQIKFDATKLTQTHRIVGIASLVLLISLFLPWFNASNGLFSVSVSGESAHGYLWITFILSLAIVALMAVKAFEMWAFPTNAPVDEERALLIATVINLVLVVLAFLLKPAGGWGWSFGAFIGLIAAIVAVVPLARPALAARKAK
jgi:hypothetical protein